MPLVLQLLLADLVCQKPVIWAKTLNSEAEKWGYINCMIFNERVIRLWHRKSSTGFWEGWCEEISLCYSQCIAGLQGVIVGVLLIFSFRGPTRVTSDCRLGKLKYEHLHLNKATRLKNTMYCQVSDLGIWSWSTWAMKQCRR